MTTDVLVDAVGLVGPRRRFEWPKDWPVPHVGDEVRWPQENSRVPLILFVRSLCWYPQGSPDGDHKTPFVYVVLGPSRRSQ